MNIDTYTIRGLDEICSHLKKYRTYTEDWQANFYTVDDVLLCSFENDEDTLDRLFDNDSLYAMVTEVVDFAMMMGIEFDF